MQQHSLVLVRGGGAQDCPGVKYRLIRGALDLVGLSTSTMKSEVLFFHITDGGGTGRSGQPDHVEIQVRDEEAECCAEVGRRGDGGSTTLRCEAY